MAASESKAAEPAFALSDRFRHPVYLMVIP